MEQLIYTYCKNGIGAGDSDFKIYTCSPNAHREQITDVKNKICLYTPPLSGIYNRMPTCFKYTSIRYNNTCSISKSSFIENFTSKDGKQISNYICHVFTVGLDKISFYPALFFNSKIFLQSISSDERDSENVAELLPAVKIQDFKEFGFCKISDVVNFIKKDAERIKYLKMIVAAIIESSVNQKRIVICDDSDNIPLYIAAATLCFPAEIAKNISFSSYEYDPADCGNVLICGVLPSGTNYDASFAQKNSDKYYVFDFKNSIMPKIEVPQNNYFRLIDLAFDKSFAIMLKFNLYVASVGIISPNSEIYRAADVYSIFQNGTNKISEEEYSTAVAFLNENSVARRIFTPVSNKTAKILSDIGIISINPLTAKAFVNFLKKNDMSLYSYCESYPYTYWNGVWGNVVNVDINLFENILSDVFEECEKNFTLATEIFIFFALRLDSIDHVYLQKLCDKFFEYVLGTKKYFEQSNFEEVLKFAISSVTDNADIPNTFTIIAEKYENQIEFVSNRETLLYNITKIYNYRKENNIFKIPNKTAILLAVNKIINGEDVSSVYEMLGVLDFRLIDDSDCEKYVSKMAEYISVNVQSSIGYDCFFFMLEKANQSIVYKTCTKLFIDGFIKTNNTLPLLSLIYSINCSNVENSIISECENDIVKAIASASARHYNSICQTAYSSFPDDFIELHWRPLYLKIKELKGSTFIGKIKLLLGL